MDSKGTFWVGSIVCTTNKHRSHCLHNKQKHPNPEAPPKTRREGEGKGGGGRKKKKGGKEGREERRILGSVWE